MKQDIEILKAGNTGDIFKDVQNIIEQKQSGKAAVIRTLLCHEW